MDVALIAVGVGRRWLFLQAWSEMVAFGPPFWSSSGHCRRWNCGIREKEVPLYCKMACEVPRIGCSVLSEAWLAYDWR